mmetsp:Transcript_17341/g.51726  ORF Transcript_17341/g.51726 Transcript_17341/m.51726 type:complete len:463 (-) Transcript_17341:152-1540(-)
MPERQGHPRVFLHLEAGAYAVGQHVVLHIDPQQSPVLRHLRLPLRERRARLRARRLGATRVGVGQEGDELLERNAPLVVPVDFPEHRLQLHVAVVQVQELPAHALELQEVELPGAVGVLHPEEMLPRLASLVLGGAEHAPTHPLDGVRHEGDELLNANLARVVFVQASVHGPQMRLILSQLQDPPAHGQELLEGDRPRVVLVLLPEQLFPVPAAHGVRRALHARAHLVDDRGQLRLHPLRADLNVPPALLRALWLAGVSEAGLADKVQQRTYRHIARAPRRRRQQSVEHNVDLRVEVWQIQYLTDDPPEHAPGQRPPADAVLHAHREVLPILLGLALCGREHPLAHSPNWVLHEFLQVLDADGATGPTSTAETFINALQVGVGAVGDLQHLSAHHAKLLPVHPPRMILVLLAEELRPVAPPGAVRRCLHPRAQLRQRFGALPGRRRRPSVHRRALPLQRLAG